MSRNTRPIKNVTLYTTTMLWKQLNAKMAIETLSIYHLNIALYATTMLRRQLNEKKIIETLANRPITLYATTMLWKELNAKISNVKKTWVPWWCPHDW